MKFFVPQVSQEYILDMNCRIELKIIYINKKIIEHFKPNSNFNYSYGYGQKEPECVDIVLKEGTKIKCTSVIHKYREMFVQFKHVESKNSFILPTEELEELSFKTKEKIILKIDWQGKYPQKGRYYNKNKVVNDNVCTGLVNGEECFNVILKSVKLEPGKHEHNRTFEYISDIEYTLKDIISDEEIGTWKTMTTIRKKALEVVKNNKNKYFSKKQKQRMRKHKFNRL